MAFLYLYGKPHDNDHTMKDKTLREHMKEAVRARWAKTTPEQRKEYSRKMNEAKNLKYPKKTASTGEKSVRK